MSPVKTQPVLEKNKAGGQEPSSTNSSLGFKTLAFIRRSLEERNEELARQLESGSLQDPDYLPFESGDLGSSDDPAELVFGIFERERTQSIAETLRTLLRQNQEALDRIAKGSYGECTRCGDPIAPERLKAIPSAQMCVQCRQAEDRANEFRLAATPKVKARLWG